MGKRTSFPALLVAAALTFSACSGGDNASQVAQGERQASTAGASTNVESEAPEGPSEDEVRAFFEAYASGDPVRTGKAAKDAAPGSIAQAYMMHQAAAQQSMIDGGGAVESQEVTSVDGGYELCDSDNCSVFADIQARGDKLASFTVGGNILKSRLLVGDNKNYSIGLLGTVKLLSAYEATGSDVLIVTLEVKSKVAGLAIESRTAYVGKSGRQQNPNSYAGPSSLLSGGTGTYLIEFVGAKMGGRLHLEMYPEDVGSPASVDIPIK